MDSYKAKDRLKFKNKVSGNILFLSLFLNFNLLVFFPLFLPLFFTLFLFFFLFLTPSVLPRVFLSAVLGFFLLSVDSALADTKPPFSLPKRAELLKLQSAVLYTNKGEIAFKLYPQEAPWHVANLKYLCDKGFYKNNKFHLYKPGYILQAGAPHGNPKEGPGYLIPAEFNDHKHVAGTLGMARLPEDLNPRRKSHASQFHILLTTTSRMDGAFTIFGDVIGGMETLYELREGDTIRDFKVFVAE